MSAKSLEAKSCIVCGASVRLLEDTLTYQDIPVQYAICDHCELITKTPASHPSNKAEKAQYETHENGMDNTGYINYLSRFAETAVDPFIKQGRGLDFGSGPGPVLYELLKQKGFIMEHYDPFYHPDKSYQNKHFDLITTTEVFEHLKHPKETFEHLIKRLRPKGILAIQTEFHPNNDQVLLDWWYRRDYTHITFYTVQTFNYLSTVFPVKMIYSNDKNIVVFQKEVNP